MPVKPQAAAIVATIEGSGTVAKAVARSCSKVGEAPGMGAVGNDVL